ncbi:hypothetical protein CYMTET_35311 [Cymbomonas tetramitiformis]|uniref:Uncharacterized protein n=1 Tax=Cymbomonas tetramitiformis TaxID=36881 RepID=A0AAE0F9C6_9CHLO|nr:hypothetical protein CYMTET_35311 [Cymbomonas tetramitiformis]
MGSTVGVDVAEQFKPSIAKHNLTKKVVAYVKDDGGNLHTCAEALSGSATLKAVESRCPGIDLDKCNKQLQTCVTYTKKSGPGAGYLVDAQKQNNLPVQRLFTNVKTRFTSTYKFFKSLVDNEKVVNVMFSSMVPRAYRDRVPTKETDAYNRVGRLYFTFNKEITEIEGTRDALADTDLTEQQRFCVEMRREVLTWMRPFLEPLFTVVPDKAHAFVALMVDPRYKGLGVICGLIGARPCQALRTRYDQEHLLPMLSAFYKASHAASDPVAATSGRAGTDATPVGEEGCEDLLEDESIPEEEVVHVAMIAGLKKFRSMEAHEEELREADLIDD